MADEYMIIYATDSTFNRVGDSEAVFLVEGDVMTITSTDDGAFETWGTYVESDPNWTKIHVASGFPLSSLFGRNGYTSADFFPYDEDTKRDYDAAVRSVGGTTRSFRPGGNSGKSEQDARQRWWPSNAQEDLIPDRAGEMIYAMLGPIATAQLIDVLRASEGRVSSSLEQLTAQLAEADGLRPTMLIALASALGAAYRYEIRDRSTDASDREWTGVDRLLGETTKHLGWLFAQALGQFGFGESSFRDWYETQSTLIWAEDDWPPTGSGYGTLRPTASDRLPHNVALQDDCGLPSLLGDLGVEINTAQPESIDWDRVQADLAVIDPSIEQTRGFARLTSSAAQELWGLFHLPSEDETTYLAAWSQIDILLKVLSTLPLVTWNRLTAARRICFVADLGEIVRMALHLEQQEIADDAIAALRHACANDEDLIAVAAGAGHGLDRGSHPLESGRLAFDRAIDQLRRDKPLGGESGPASSRFAWPNDAREDASAITEEADSDWAELSLNDPDLTRLCRGYGAAPIERIEPFRRSSEGTNS